MDTAVITGTFTALLTNSFFMDNIVIFGAPGSGKGTYSAELVKHFGFGHISTGDVLRGEIQACTELGKIAKGYIEQGQLIPDELMIDILTKVYDEKRALGKGVIFDGFPRTLAQAEALKSMLESRGESMTIALNLIVDDAELIRRLLHRAEVEGRADDNEDTIRKRFEVYHSKTKPLIDWFRNEGVLEEFTFKGSCEGMVKELIDKLESLQS